MAKRVIPRLQHRRHTSERRFAFGRCELGRPLQIYIDSDSLNPSDELDLLCEFAAHPQVTVATTDASTTDRVEVGAFDPRRGYRPFNLLRADGEGFYSAVGGNIPDAAREYARPGEEAEAERAVALALGAANHGCDALVTANDLLLEAFPRNLIEGANPMRASEAVALLGLFLRAREDPTVYVEPKLREYMRREWFYFVAMRELTPSGWRWFSGCVEGAQHTSDDELVMIAQSGMERLEHALRARDRLHEKLQLPTTAEIAADAIFYFDATMLMLGGVFDVLALVANRVHATSASDHEVGWARSGWMRELKQVNRPLAQMMGKTKPHRDARELVAVLRNTIHSEAIRAVTWRVAGTSSARVQVPETVAVRLEEITARLGTPFEFGLSRERDGRAYVEPGFYVEATFLRVIAAVNAIMDSTPVENLPGVNPRGLLTGPPNDPSFSPASRKRVRLLAGFS